MRLFLAFDMNLVLTSDLPSTGNEVAFDFMRRGLAHPRIAWIPPFTDVDRKRFVRAQEQFDSYGFDGLEYCDIDERIDEKQLSHLHEYDIVYLSGGDPIRFRHNLLRAGLSEQLQRCFAAGRLVVAASGGSTQLTRNVSLFRLQTETIDEVFANRREYEGLGVVDYEILPHLNTFQPIFLEAVRQYSKRVVHDIIAVADGAAILHTSRDNYRCVGQAARLRNGVVVSIDAASHIAC